MKSREQYKNRTYTKIILEDGLTIIQCNDCNAYAEKPGGIKHHDTCQPGEAAYWRDFYREASLEYE